MSLLSIIISFIGDIFILVQGFFDQIFDILDFYLPGWKLIVLSPLVIAFVILPFLLVFYLYFCAIMFHFYRRRHAIYEGFHNHSVWEGYKKLVAIFWSGHGWIWHGYEVEGMENVPDSGPILIVYYHGAVPVDLYYFMANLYLEKGRTLCNIMDNFALKVPGLSRMFHFFRCFPGPRDKVVELLKNGEVVCVAPGGVREAQFSENYQLMWEKRQGFAKAAIEAHVPILPLFTQNNRQAFNYLPLGKNFFRKLYEKIRFPVRPCYGGLPVKMKTFVGKPINFPKNAAPATVVYKTKEALEELIQKHQEIPGSILKSFLCRFHTKKTTEVTVAAVEKESLINNGENVNVCSRNIAIDRNDDKPFLADQHEAEESTVIVRKTM